MVEERKTGKGKGMRKAGAALALALLLSAGALASNHASKCDDIVARELSSGRSARLSLVAKVSGELTPHQERQLRALGADIYRHLPIIHSVAFTLPRKRLSRCLDLSFVDHVSFDGQVQKSDAFTVGSSWASSAWQQYNVDGSGVGIAVIDSGVTNEPDFNNLLLFSRVKAQANFVGGTNCNDDCGHGTHVAGIAAGNGASSDTLLLNTKTFFGIAKNANIVSVKVLDQYGHGTVSNVVSGIQWAVANRANYNIRVINLSLGHPISESYTTDPLCQAVEYAWKSGIVVVCAAGNDGRLSSTQTPGAPNEGWGTNYGSIESPGNDPYVITVGAMKNYDGNRANDRIATYSSRGPSIGDFVLKPDIVAPGNQVISVEDPNTYLVSAYASTNLVPYSYYTLVGSLLHNNHPTNQYFILSGTSMATPVVSGAVALMLQKNPNLSPDTVKVRLMVPADKWCDPSGNYDPCTYGAGYLNIPNAMASTLVATQYAMSPTLSEDANGNVYINQDASLWGTRAVWGTGSVDSARAVWGTGAVNSDNSISSSRAVWGTGAWSTPNGASMSTAGVDLSAGGVPIQGEH